MLVKGLGDALASEDSSFQTGDFEGFEIGKVLGGSAAAFSTGDFANKVRSDPLTGKAATFVTGTIVYNAPPAEISVLLGGQVIVVTAGTLSTTSAGQTADLTGKAATFSLGAMAVVRSDALTGKAAAFSTGVVSTGLYNVQATTDGSNVTITATSSLDLSDPARYGVEFGDGSGGVYQWAISEPGAVSSQSITIGEADGVVPGNILSYRPYYNLTNADPPSSRIYGAAGEILVSDVGGITGKAATFATGQLQVIRHDVLLGSASVAATFTAGTLVFTEGASSADLIGQAVTVAAGTLTARSVITATLTGQAADFAPGPAGFDSEFDALILGQG